MLADTQRAMAPALLALVASVLLSCDAKAPNSSAPPAESVGTTKAQPDIDKAKAQGADNEAPQPQLGKAGRPMLIEFSRDYCTPCQIMKPWVGELAKENPQVDILTLNVDRKKNEHIGSFFQITAVPSLVYVSPAGEVLRRSEGLAKKEQMNKALEELGWAP